MSFASGFYGRVADNMQDKKQFIRERVEEDRLYLREEGLKRQAGVTQQRLAYQTAAQSLIDRGANEQAVLANLESNPQGVLDIYNRDITDSTQLNNIFQLSEEYSGSGATLEDIINKVLPVTSQLPAGTDPTTVRRTGIAAWLGLDTDAALQDQVYSQHIVGGMTGDQILATMNVPVNAQGTRNSGASLNYDAVDDKPMTQGQRSDAYTRAYEEYQPGIEAKIDELSTELLGDLENGLEGVDPASERGLELKKQIEALRGLGSLTTPKRLEVLIPIMGVLPNLRAQFDSNPGLFSAEYFSVDFMDAFKTEEEELNEDGVITPPEVPPAGLGGGDDPEAAPVVPEGGYPNNEAALAGLTAFFRDNPDAAEATVVIDGVSRTFDNPNKPAEVEERPLPNTPSEEPDDLYGGSLPSGGMSRSEDRQVARQDMSTGPGTRPNVGPMTRSNPAAVELKESSATANDLVDMMLNGASDDTDLKERIQEAVLAGNVEERRSVLTAILEELDNAWTQSTPLDALRLMIEEVMEAN